MSTYQKKRNSYGPKYPVGRPYEKRKQIPSIRPAGATTKDCKICGSHLNVKHFYKTCGKVCKKCHNIRTKAYYLANRGKPKTFLQRLKGLFS